MSSKFKVGDMVRVLAETGLGPKIGDIFNIIRIEDDRLYRSNELYDYCFPYEIELVKPKIETTDITKDLKKALTFLDLHDKDQFMLDNIISTLGDRINEITRT